MGEALLRQALAKRGVVGVDVASAGTGAWQGAPASEAAYLVGLEQGLDLSPHRATLLTSEIASGASLLLTMARHHRSRVLELVPDARVHLLGEFAGRRGAEAEVADPYGADLEAYRQTRDELASMMDAVAARIVAEHFDDRR
jgi:protein-tyrosine-phosphatase